MEKHNIADWSNGSAREPHKLEVCGSIPLSATPTLEKQLEELSFMREDRSLSLTILEFSGMRYFYNLDEQQALRHLRIMYSPAGQRYNRVIREVFYGEE